MRLLQSSLMKYCAYTVLTPNGDVVAHFIWTKRRPVV